MKKLTINIQMLQNANNDNDATVAAIKRDKEIENLNIDAENT